MDFLEGLPMNDESTNDALPNTNQSTPVLGYAYSAGDALIGSSSNSKNLPNLTASNSENIQSSSSPPYGNEHMEEKYLLQLMQYRNIAWRYLLCYCLPLQQEILYKQLKIQQEREQELFEK